MASMTADTFSNYSKSNYNIDTLYWKFFYSKLGANLPIPKTGNQPLLSDPKKPNSGPDRT